MNPIIKDASAKHHVSIPLSPDVNARLSIVASQNNMTLSEWLSEFIQVQLEKNQVIESMPQKKQKKTEWSKEVRALAGAWKDSPTLAEIRSDLPMQIDERESL